MRDINISVMSFMSTVKEQKSNDRNAMRCDENQMLDAHRIFYDVTKQILIPLKLLRPQFMADAIIYLIYKL